MKGSIWFLVALATLAMLAGPAALAGQPKGEGGEAEGEDTGPSVSVIPDDDALVLRDGTRIEGTVLCAGQAAVTILTADGEKTIPREKIERIVKNIRDLSPQEWAVEEVDGHKYIVEKGVATASAAEGGPATPAKPKARTATPKAGPKKPKARPDQGKTPNRQPPAPKPKPPAEAAGIEIPDDPAEVRALLQRLRKEGKLQEVLKNPEAFKKIREALKKE
ncbi:MAG: hypothetical protein ACLF0G_00585 [Candidatus Brocadiia bacterium]